MPVYLVTRSLSGSSALCPPHTSAHPGVNMGGLCLLPNVLELGTITTVNHICVVTDVLFVVLTPQRSLVKGQTSPIWKLTGWLRVQRPARGASCSSACEGKYLDWDSVMWSSVSSGFLHVVLKFWRKCQCRAQGGRELQLNCVAVFQGK